MPPDGAAEAPHVWKTIARAIGAEPRSDLLIRGSSGMDHRVEAIAVDDPGRRVVMIIAEPDGRTAALVQSDIQTTMPDVHVLVARPQLFDLGDIARRLAAHFGTTRFSLSDLKIRFDALSALPREKQSAELQKTMEDVVRPLVLGFEHTRLPTMGHIMDVVRQATHFDWQAHQFVDSPEGKKELPDVVQLDSLVTLDNIALDRQAGVCALPLYEFLPTDWELFASGAHLDVVRERMKDLGIFQYFFPPPDHLALGLVDRGVSHPSALIEAMKSSRELGHPFGAPEILALDAKVEDTITGLQDKGLVVEVERHFEVTATGVSTRAVVKGRPREGLVSKLLGAVKVDPIKLVTAATTGHVS